MELGSRYSGATGACGSPPAAPWWPRGPNSGGAASQLLQPHWRLPQKPRSPFAAGSSSGGGGGGSSRRPRGWDSGQLSAEPRRGGARAPCSPGSVGAQQCLWGLDSLPEVPGKRRRSGSSGDRPGARRGRPAPGRSRRELSLVPGVRPAARPSPSWAGWKRGAIRGGQVLSWAISERRAGSGPSVEAGGHPPSLCVLGEAWSHSPQWVPAWCCPSCLLWWPLGTHTCQPSPSQGQVGPCVRW